MPMMVHGVSLEFGSMLRSSGSGDVVFEDDVCVVAHY